MKKLTAFILALVALSPSAAIAQVSAYLGADGFFSIRGLQPSKSYRIDLGGMPLISAGRSNSCGILRVANNTQVKASDRIEIRDEAANQIYGFENNNSLPTKDIKCITNQVKPEREIWKDAKGTIWISGLTPSSAQTIRLLSSNPDRTIRANQCGMVSFRLSNPEPKAIILDNQAFPLTGATRGGGIACRKGIGYVAYPQQPEIVPVAATEWKQQNPTAFDVNAFIAQWQANNTVQWGIITTGGSGGSSQTAGGGGANNTPPPTTTTTYTRSCKLNSNTLVVVGLSSNTLYQVSGSDGNNVVSATSNSSGYAEFSPINFNATYEGSPDVLDLFNPNFDYIRNIFPNLSAAPGCP
jgi:hypothetical protein